MSIKLFNCIYFVINIERKTLLEVSIYELDHSTHKDSVSYMLTVFHVRLNCSIILVTLPGKKNLNQKWHAMSLDADRFLPKKKKQS